MDKKVRENILVSSAKLELQKIQALVNTDTDKHLSSEYENKMLNKDIILRNDLLKDDREVSSKLLDRIDGRQEALEDILSEVNSVEVQCYNELSISQDYLKELRELNPTKAAELENSVRMKKKKISSERKGKNR